MYWVIPSAVVVVQGLLERANQWEEMNSRITELTSQLNSAESDRNETEALLREKEAEIAAAIAAQRQAESDRAQVVLS